MVVAIAQILAALATAILAFLTWKYVQATKAMVEEMKATREESSRPYIVVDLLYRPAKDFFELSVKNVGLTAASEVKIDINPPLVCVGKKSLQDLTFVNKGIPIMPPGKEIKTVIETIGHFIKSEDLPREYVAKVSYKDCLDNRSYKEEYVLDINTYLGLTQVEFKDLSDINNRLEEISKGIKGIAESYKG